MTHKTYQVHNSEIFGTDGIRGQVGVFPIIPDFILKLGWAIGEVFAGGSGHVLVGKDTRISGYMFESALESGLVAAGKSVDLLGPMPTPAIAYLTRTLRASAGIVISASHNPYGDNGFKFFSSSGRKLPDELEQAIANKLQQPMTVTLPSNLGKVKRLHDAAGRYIEFCKSTFSRTYSLKGMKIVIDCANGSTYSVAPQVFTELEATVITLFAEPNGYNINDQCGTTQPQRLREEVLSQQADFGIAFDGDGDRVIMVDHQGGFVDGDDILYILAQDWLSIGRLQGGVVGTQMSNLGLEKAILGLGLEFDRSKVGDRYVLEQLERRGWFLGGESSGHILCLEMNTTGDGIISALQIVLAMVRSQKTLVELRQGLVKYPQCMVNVRLEQPCDINNSQKVNKTVKNIQNNLQEKGRVLLRMSGTEPVIRVMVEGEEEAKVSEYANILAEVVREECI